MSETTDKTSYIRDVWYDNLEAEMANIREMIVQYPVISMVCSALSDRARPPAPRPRSPRAASAWRARRWWRGGAS